MVLLTTVASYSAEGVPVNQGSAKIPLIDLSSVNFGNSLFGSMESFHIHLEHPIIHRNSASITLSFSGKFVSPIADSLFTNQSIHISKNAMTVPFDVPEGTVNVSIPPQRSYLNVISLVGNSSFHFVTLVERVQSDVISVNEVPIHNGQTFNGGNIYNLSIQYNGSSFDLRSPGYVTVGTALSVVSLTVKNLGSLSLLAFSFPLKDGVFHTQFNQVLSSQQNVNSYVMSYYQMSGFSNPIIANLVSDSVALILGGSIFVILIVGLFMYYRKK